MTDLDNVDQAGRDARESAYNSRVTERERVAAEAVAVPLREQLAAAAGQLANRTTERDNAVASVAARVKERDDALATVTTRDGTIVTLNGLIASLRARITELEAQIPVVTPPTPTVEPSPGLFFKRAEYKGPKKVTAHYFGPYPQSTDNLPRDQDWYAKYGVNPDYSTYADSRGWFDTRPIARAPLSGDWKLEDCKNDIRTAQKYGVDVFYCDLLGTSGTNYDNYRKLVQAAEELNTGFLVAPMLDGNGAHSVNNVNTPEVAARAIFDSYWGKKSTWMIDGGFVISSFKGEARDVAWWPKLFDALKGMGVPKVSFQMGLLNYGSAAGYASITAGEGNWGDGDDPATIKASANKTAQSKARGKSFTYPVGGGQIRRAQGGNFDEVLNTEGLRAHWDKVVRDNPDFVQLVTWSDYSEGAMHAPSEARGFTSLILDAYYSEWWKQGAAPAILRDEIIVSHRESRRDATPQKTSTKHLVQWTGNGRGGPFSPVRDAVEVLTFLTKPAAVTVDVGPQRYTYTAPAGMYTRTFDMTPGVVRATTERGTTVTGVAPITATPVRETAIYLAASAITGTAGQRVSVV